MNWKICCWEGRLMTNLNIALHACYVDITSVF
jgi:hypothetical protein